MLDRALIKGVALRRVKIERATKIHCALPLAIRGQRNCNARSVAVCEGSQSPRRKLRIRPDIVDRTSLAGPNRDAERTLTCFCLLSPGNLHALQVVDTVSRLGHRPNSLLDIIFAIANPGQPNLTAGHENFASGLQQLLLALALKERTVARSEERRVGKECRSRWVTDQYKQI